MDTEEVARATQTGSYQDEEALVGELLVLGDGGEHGQHQAAEHQQEAETQARTHTHRSAWRFQNTHIRNENAPLIINGLHKTH